ncbi:hypothetical protein HHK36_005869 [Tetracentron sinense]|uniref:25S rRNA (uridine-N(3))-methyltransferase BMT5-like domain-containing protein n=1 Tax=Tetracentron sinense TaxID=13715 RepID=A0A834ZLW8_TETSI|nr:hypothetical protein HHK36_005869 [Tetracentron sinense]
MVATSLDSKETLKTKHWSCVPHLKELKRLGCLVLHEVDVYDMDGHPTLMTMKFDRIIFNFPHAGHFPWLCERDDCLIEMHKELLMDFFRSACEMLTKGGEVHVSHRDDYPYKGWNIEELAKRAGLDLKDKVEFRKMDYPGYHNKRGGDIKSNKTFPLRECFTFKFSSSGEFNSLRKMMETGSGSNGL